MKRFNLSAWAVSHPALVLFLMVALGVAGFFSYRSLGRAEDPFFTVTDAATVLKARGGPVGPSGAGGGHAYPLALFIGGAM